MASADVKQHVYLLTGRIISWVEVLPYVHRNRRFIRDGEPRTATSTFTQILNSAKTVRVQCCFMSTETMRTIRDREPRTATSTFTQLLSSVRMISNQSMDRTKGLLGARELCESRDGRPWPHAVPNSPYGPCGRKATLEEEEPKASELRSCVKGEVVVLK